MELENQRLDVLRGELKALPLFLDGLSSEF